MPGIDKAVLRGHVELMKATDGDRVVAPWLADAPLPEAVRKGYVAAPLMVADAPPPRMPVVRSKQLLEEIDQDRQDR